MADCNAGVARVGYVTEKFTTNKFAAYRPRKPHQAFYLQLTERKIITGSNNYHHSGPGYNNGNR
ncbi:hypothetical protein [Chitinophaga sp. CB10]|uniref:hypothetical protein n=1 Tax=Chitinophaga sp. CB10 TaxID=1891659 RepID=UPI0025C59F8D|nr:hypothetical protein [Chitinophaga sp. CB10]